MQTSFIKSSLFFIFFLYFLFLLYYCEHMCFSCARHNFGCDLLLAKPSAKKKYKKKHSCTKIKGRRKCFNRSAYEQWNQQQQKVMILYDRKRDAWNFPFISSTCIYTAETLHGFARLLDCSAARHCRWTFCVFTLLKRIFCLYTNCIRVFYTSSTEHKEEQLWEAIHQIKKNLLL